MTSFHLDAGYKPLFPFGYDIMGGTANPADMRVVNLDFEPTYYAEDTFISLTLDQAIGDYHDLTVSAAFLDTSFRSRTDFDGSVGAPITNAGAIGIGLSPAVGLLAPITSGALYANGELPYSNISTSNLGVIGLDILGSVVPTFLFVFLHLLAATALLAVALGGYDTVSYHSGEAMAGEARFQRLLPKILLKNMKMT